MPKASPIQTSFNGGEFSPLLNGQVTFEKRQTALELCQNLIALKQGPAMRRGGTIFVKEIKSSSNRTELIDFQFSADQVYQIEVGDQYFRFYKDNAIITQTAQNITGITKANPAVLTYSGADNFTNGKEVYITGVVGMTEVNDKFFKVANVNVGANTFELQDIDGNNINSASYTTYTSGGTAAQVYEVSSPYTQANLFDSDNIFQIHYVQSADVLYLLHGSYKMRSLTRAADASWTLTTLTNEDGPYLDTNTTATTLTLSGTSGSVTVTASATTGINNDSGFASTDVGRLIRWKDPAGNWTWLTITAYTSTTQVTATISGPNASAGTATINWRLGLWSDNTGWPITGTFYQDRFALGGCTDFPDTLALTESGAYSNTTLGFAPSAADGTVADDNAIVKTLPSRQVNSIQWMAADITGLVLGTTGQEWTLKAGVAGEPLTPSNAVPTPISTTKSAFIQPMLASSGLLFVQKSRRSLYDMIYSYDIDRLKPRDISITAEHIIKDGIISMAYQQEPVNVIWQVRQDGVLIGLTYYPDEKVFGWHRHIIGGVSDAIGTDAQVEAISVIPSSDGSRDELWLIVKRYINGTTRRYVEYMNRYYDTDLEIYDSYQIDSVLTLDSPVTITGATKTDPVVITAASHGFSNGDYVDIRDIYGMTELNGNRYIVANKAANTFELTDTNGDNVDGTGYTTYISGGTAREAVTTVTNLNHLEGETVKVMIDGKSHPDLTVSSGSITLANSRRASIIHIGLAYAWALKTLKIEAGAADGTAQGKTKRINNVTIQLLNTLGLFYGPDEDTLDEYDFDQGAAYDETPALYTGDTETLLFPDGYNTNGQIYLTDEGVFPACITAIMPQLTTQDR